MFRQQIWLSMAIIAALMVGCGGDDAVGTIVGPEGGEVSADGVTLTVPEGALAEEVDIVITTSAAEAQPNATALSPTFRFEPSGLVFASPVTLTIALSEAPPSGALIFWTSGDGITSPIPTTLSASAATFEVDHFSEGTLWSAAFDLLWDTGLIALGCEATGLGQPGKPCCAGACFQDNNPPGDPLTCLDPEIVVEGESFAGHCEYAFLYHGDPCTPSNTPSCRADQGLFCQCVDSVTQGQPGVCLELRRCNQDSDCDPNPGVGCPAWCQADHCGQKYCYADPNCAE